MKKNKLNIYIKILLLVLGVFLITYILILINIKRIEAELTFPGKNINFLDIKGICLDIDIDLEEINIDDGNGNNINGLFLKGDKEEAVYYFHGNGGPINCFYSEIKYINDLGYSVFAYDYPGYGKSGAYPYEETINNFSDKFFQYIKKEKNIENEKLILWGFSVGTAVVTDFAAKNEYSKLILFAPFSSRYDLTENYIGFIAQKFFFLKDSFVTKDLIKKLNKPLLVVHGNVDNIVPFEQGKLVYKNAGGEKYFIELDNESHNYIISNYGESLKGVIINFINGDNKKFKDGYLFIDEKIKDKLEFEYRNDLYSDSSIQKFVTSTISFDNVEYYPNDLVNISGKYIYDMKGGSQKIRKNAKEALDELGEAFYETFNKKLNVVSAFRSYDYQRAIKANGCPDNFCAKAGYSEHQTGLVVDIFEASSEMSWNKNPTLMKYFMWLSQNAHLYGFHNTYQKGIEIDGYEIEPWHWRYLGIELATYLFENKITIAEYYNQKSSIKTGFHRKKKTNKGNFIVRDEYAIKAQKEGYRARSVYKLLEIQERFGILNQHSKVIDIGAAPGSFLQALGKIIKDKIIIGVDIKEIKPFSNANIKTIVNDIFDYDTLSEKIINIVGDNQFDVITSDIAPNTTGVFDVDQYASVELNIAICKFSDKFLRKGGNMILKVFKGQDFNELVLEVKKRFEKMKTYKPLACRDSSHEEYVICLNKIDQKKDNN